MRKLKNIMVTGGAGFIGSNFIRRLFRDQQFKGKVVNLDALTYAGNPENLTDIKKEQGGRRYFFELADLADHEALKTVFEKYDIDTVVHFAAESHVDRSIYGPKDFVSTNITGSFNLLETARELWSSRESRQLQGGNGERSGQGPQQRKGSPFREGVHFHHVSTDEVYGSLEPGEFFFETTPYDPHSPYAASKASSDHLVKAYWHTYGLPVTISNCSNNYGPCQFPEKLIPLMILNMLDGKPLPVYGDGRQVRDWLYVEDHAAAIMLILEKGRTGETYNIGGGNQKENLELLEILCAKVAARTGTDPCAYRDLITPVTDRPGHDRRYAMNYDKIRAQLGWWPETTLDQGLDLTIDWYLSNREWVDRVRSGAYREWIEKNYSSR